MSAYEHEHERGVFVRCTVCKAWCRSGELVADDHGSAVCPACADGVCVGCHHGSARNGSNLCCFCADMHGVTQLLDVRGCGIRVRTGERGVGAHSGINDGVVNVGHLLQLVLARPSITLTGTEMSWGWSRVSVPVWHISHVELRLPLPEDWRESGDLEHWGQALAWLETEDEAGAGAAASGEIDMEYLPWKRGRGARPSSQTRGRARGNGEPPHAKHLSQEERRCLHLAALTHNWLALFAGLREYDQLDAEDTRYCDELFGSYVHHVLDARGPVHQLRWDRRVGALARDLALPNTAGIVPSMGEALVGSVFENDPTSLAYENAFVDLKAALVGGERLTVSRASALVGGAWRDAFVAALAAAISADPASFFARLANAPSPNGVGVADQRQQRVRALIESVGSLHALAGALTSRRGNKRGPDGIHRLYSAYARACGGDPGSSKSRPVDAVDLLLDLLSADLTGVRS